jgi:hypothetical protein
MSLHCVDVDDIVADFVDVEVFVAAVAAVAVAAVAYSNKKRLIISL